MDNASSIGPSSYPLRFDEVTNFAFEYSNTLTNAKGVAYHRGLDRILTTVTPDGDPGGEGERRIKIYSVAANGRRERFSPNYTAYRAVESLLAVVPPDGPPVAAGFTSGDVFINRGGPTIDPNGGTIANPELGWISRLDGLGSVITDEWAKLEHNGQSNGLWGGLCFDRVGTFGGALLAIDIAGRLFKITSGGTYSLIADLTESLRPAQSDGNFRIRTEGIAVAPRGFGPVGGQVIVGIEGNVDAGTYVGDEDPFSGKIFAINAAGTPTLLADIGFSAENLVFVPEGSGTFYQTEINYRDYDHPRDNRMLAASASQFLGRRGSLIISAEMSGEFWEIAWSGHGYTQSLIGRAPGRWSSQGFARDGTELEHADFAAFISQPPIWTTWNEVPGHGTTDLKPEARVDHHDNLHLFAIGRADRCIYLQSMDGASEKWLDTWQRVEPFMTTNHDVCTALHEYYLYVFAVADDGGIMYKRLFGPDSILPADPWTKLPDLHTEVAPSATVATGRLVVCAVGQDHRLHLNELSPGGRNWSGWQPISGQMVTDISPTLITFQDELYILVVDPANRMQVAARSADASAWTDWTELPGSRRTDASLAATNSSQDAYLVAKGIGDNYPYVNIASSTGTWSGWSRLNDPGQTDTTYGATAIGSRIYLFAKGTDDHGLYFRRTI
jgi:hypothetical protein